MSVTNPMALLYRRLSRVGLTRQFVRCTALPKWWDDEIADSPAGYAEGLLLLSRHLGLDLATLQDESTSLALRYFGPCKFKKTTGVTDDELALARAMATRAAQLAAAAMTTPLRPVPASAAEVRQHILDRGESWVGLDALVDYCWSVGIPVLHLSQFPPRIKKMHGLAAKVSGRPAIILCRNQKYTAWLLFILAHELGHLIKGHVADDGVLLDERVEEDNNLDAEETEANAFAVELLTGDARCRFHAGGHWPNASNLAQEARSIGRQSRIDPGHIVLNYAHAMGKDFFAVANATLNLLEPKADAVGLIRGHMAARLDWSNLPEDSCEFLMRITQIEQHHEDLPR
ncbi:MAG: ImmA/IrrE family metallo-endopeptidase [Gemmataceae bacterium]